MPSSCLPARPRPLTVLQVPGVGSSSVTAPSFSQYSVVVAVWQQSDWPVHAPPAAEQAGALQGGGEGQGNDQARSGGGCQRSVVAGQCSWAAAAGASMPPQATSQPGQDRLDQHCRPSRTHTHCPPLQRQPEVQQSALPVQPYCRLATQALQAPVSAAALPFWHLSTPPEQQSAVAAQPTLSAAMQDLHVPPASDAASRWHLAAPQQAAWLLDTSPQPYLSTAMHCGEG